MAHGRGEAPCMESKRKYDEEPRNTEGGDAGVSEAPVHSCSHVRHHLRTDTTQAVEDLVNCSFETFKRSRMEAARKDQIYPVRTNGDDNFTWRNDEPAEKPPPLHRERDIPFYHGGGSKPPREIDVPNVKASAGGAAAGGAVDYGVKVQVDKGNSMSLHLTEEYVRILHQDPKTNFAIKVT